MKLKKWGVLLFCLFIVSSAYGEEKAQVEMFSPQGTVKGVRQVSVRFSEQMVPFGDPRVLIEPFDVVCSEKGTSRWADGKNWAFDFERDLPAGIRCDFRLRSGLRTFSGKEVMGQKEFSFNTGGPSIKRSAPYEGSTQIDEEQVFILTLDAEADEESVIQNATFSIEGIQDHAGIRMIKGKQRDDLLKAIFPYMNPPHPPMILVQCKQRFPSEAKISLIWGKGITTGTGVATEQDQIIHFQVRKPFSADFHCQRENPRAGCIPLKSMELNFSAPISKSSAHRVALKGPDGKRWKSEPTEEEEVDFVSFDGPFPEETDFTVEIPDGLRDVAGRPLINADKFPLSVRTDKYPPLAKFPARFGILERKADPVLPVTVRSLEPELKGRRKKVDQEEGIAGKVIGKILNISPEESSEVQVWLRRVASASRETSVLIHESETKEFKLPKPLGPRAFEVIGMPLKDPGLYIVELESAILGNALLDPPKPMFVPTAVLVTNLSVHFKWGRESSLVWVTALDTGEPVENAEVTIRDCHEKTLWKGKSNENGVCRIDTPLPQPGELPHCDHQVAHHDYSQMGALWGIGGGLFILARTSDDMSFVHSSWDDGIEPWRFQLSHEAYAGPFIAHTVFDRTLLRAGETVHMKHIIRQHTMRGFSSVPKDRIPNSVSIEHYGSEEKYEFPLKWGSNGVAETTWAIPKDAKLGTYGVVLFSKADTEGKESPRRSFHRDSTEWDSGRFRVEEFRIPLLKATIQPPAEPLINPEEVSLDLSVQYLAGGGAGLLPIKLTGEVGPKNIAPFDGFDGYLFGNGPVKEGLVRRGEPLETEESEAEGEEGIEAEGSPAGKKEMRLPALNLVLDKSGSTRTKLSGLPRLESPKELLTEMEFKDPNGEIQTVSSRISLWHSKYLIGIKPDSWALSKDAFKFRVAVIDLSGKPVPGVLVKVDLFERRTFTHRKRLVGGFYAYEHSAEIKKVAALSEGKTDSRGILFCEAQSPVSGNVILQAGSFDDAGHRTAAHRDVWVAGKSEWWFEVANHDRIDLLPEKKRYEPGEKATFQVRMPFRSAKALITVEREGVIEAWVKRISGKNPVIEVPVKGSYAPNVFVSVLVLRGRLPWIKATSMVDLGKPAWKLGIAEINVGWREHELKVSLSSDKKVYKVRQRAKVRIKVTTSEGKAPPQGSEVAIAAVDEGLLELMANQSWDILPAMMGRRGYAIRTSTAQMQVIGKRHFGLKALPPGGGGGRQTTRELFDTLLLWKGRQLLDGNGEAMIEIPLNDSITSFRIVAVATGGIGFFGTGSTSIQSTQDLMVLSGLPPLVREGDRFRAEFTLRNTRQDKMEVDLAGKVEGISQRLDPMDLSLGPGESKEIGWEVTVPVGVEALRWEVELRDRFSLERDRIRITQKVVPAVPVRTFQGTMAQVEQEFHLSVERPKDAIAGRGGVKVTIRPKIAGGLNGIIEYMRWYPYTCMEQKISVAVALRDEKLWERCMGELPSHLDSDGLVKYFPRCHWGCPTLTSYILAIGDEAGWNLPGETKGRMETGLKRFIEGSITRYSPIRTADLTLRKLSAAEALSRGKSFEVRLLNSISIEPNLWPTSGVIDWLNILKRVEAISDRQGRINGAEQIIRSRLNFQGTTMGFSSEETDCLWWLMISNDLNAVRVILTFLNSVKWREDMPRLVQGALARQKKGAWDLTTANAWGVLALEKFSKLFEAIPVTGSTRALLAAQSQTLDWDTLSKGKTSQFSWPDRRDNLFISHQGTGRPWATIQSLAAIPLKEPFSSGYRIKKTVAPIEQKNPRQWSRGDILRVRLELEAQTDQTWVVVSDPIPSGTTILGSGLGRDSQLLTAGEKREGWVWPAYEERSFEAFRAYYEYVPKGKWMVEYTIRLNQSGVFQLPTTRVEALYFPEMLGENPNKTMVVEP